MPADFPIDIVLFGLFLLVLLGALLARDLRKTAKGGKPALSDQQSETELPPNSIVVDGSNVMHWGGEPSARVLKQVVSALVEKGLTPFVVFDASVGYRLSDRYLDDAPMAQMVGIPVSQVRVVAKGVVADEIILKFASENGLRVVTNDRYRDWSVQYPIVKDHRKFMRGDWKEGALDWQNSNRRRARA